MLQPLLFFQKQAYLETIHHFHIQFYGFHDRPTLERLSSLLSILSRPFISEFPNIYPAPKHDIGVNLCPIQSTQHFLRQATITHNHDSTSSIQQRTIVFISCLFSGNEPHGQLVIDIIKRLPREIFNCVAVGIGSKAPGETLLQALNGKYYVAGHSRQKAAQILVSLNPDCVVYVENINNPTIHFLAYERFAPIQILLMGSPITSGIASIDYFLSGDRLEHVSFLKTSATCIGILFVQG